MNKPVGPLLVIVGETASGKSAAALEIAKRLGGEIICADSRTIYRGMDIGTAKPTREERRAIPHHLLDIVSPDEQFSAARFKDLAQRTINDISQRGKLPILVGGTGLYIDAVLYDYEFRPLAAAHVRARYNRLEVAELQQLLQEKGLSLPENKQNRRHLVRVLETEGATPGRHELRANTVIVGLTVERSELQKRITDRVKAMVEQGLVDEVHNLAERYGWEAPGLSAPGYKAFRKYKAGTQTLDEAKAAFVRNDLALAKRQRTWFKRNKSIHWFSNREELNKYVDANTTKLNTF